MRHAPRFTLTNKMETHEWCQQTLLQPEENKKQLHHLFAELPYKGCLSIIIGIRYNIVYIYAGLYNRGMYHLIGVVY